MSVPKWPRTPAVAEVKWEDSMSAHNWRDRASRLSDRDRSSAITSVGYLVVNDKEKVKLTLDLDDADNIGCTITIPKFAVRSVTILRRSKEKQ